MATSNEQKDVRQPAPAPDQPQRSDNLLPADSESDDGRFEVAEEVSLDQQSDAARRIGQASPDPLPDTTARQPDPEYDLGHSSPDPAPHAPER